jgi:ubiquinone/menaquinone biosynthesis C-methylase UbiE
MVEFAGIRNLSLKAYRDHVRDHYDGHAGAMLHFASILSLHEPLVGRLLKKRRFDVTGRKSILDIGAGAGQILKHLLKIADADAQLVAIDLSTNMLIRARRRMKSTRPVYVTADMTKLPFPDGSFDVVTCGWVMEYQLDPRPALREIWRVLQPGGSLFMLATEDSIQGAFNSRTWKCRTFNRDELQAACIEVGLPWHQQLWFTRVHKLLRAGGIIFEARKT